MKQLTAIFLAALTIGFFSCTKEDTTGKDLTILTDDMKPFNYEENGIQKGITMELVLKIIDELQLTNAVKINSSWDSIFHRLQTEENIMAFTAGLTSDRKELFQWVGPVAVWRDSTKIDNLMVYSSTPAYLAFSKDVSAKLVKNWQDKLDQLKDAGFLQELYDKYLPGTLAPGRILMFTEENPPQNYHEYDGSATGSSLEMVEAMMEGTNLAGPIEFTSWTNAYNQLLLIPNTMVFSTLRSTARENLFHWVGPVCKKKYCFFVHASTDYQISTIDEARHMRSIGTVTGWASEQELLDLGFNNVVTWDTPQEVFQKLMDGDISCAVLYDISMRILRSERMAPPTTLSDRC